MRFIDGCYDEGGAYWGMPANLYRATGEDDEQLIEIFTRANSRAEAKAKVRAILPNARFYN